MKRPVGIYFVALWCGIAMLIQVSKLARLGKTLEMSGHAPVVWMPFLLLFLLAFIVWQIVGLIRLRALQRGISILYFSIWTLVFTWNSIAFGHSAQGKALAFVSLFWLIISGLNIGAVWYLARSRFREFCSEFTKENGRVP